MADTNNYMVRLLRESDKKQIEVLDNISYNDTLGGFEAGYYVYGVFSGGKLVGYCTLGHATKEEMPELGDEVDYFFVLSNLFVLDEYRGMRLGHKIIKEIGRDKNIVIEVLNADLGAYYEEIDFETVYIFYDKSRTMKRYMKGEI